MYLGEVVETGPASETFSNPKRKANEGISGRIL